AAHALARLHQLANRVCAGRGAGIEATCRTLFGAVTHERCEIAHVDVLQRIARTAGRKHLAAACSARDPVCEAISAVAGPDDIVRSHDRGTRSIDTLDDLFAARF